MFIGFTERDLAIHGNALEDVQIEYCRSALMKLIGRYVVWHLEC